MSKAVKPFFEIMTAILLITAIIGGSAFLSLEVKGSALYRQSRVLSMLIRQEPVGVAGMLEDTRNIDMAVKFAGALTSAYINFELLPMGEAATFVAVFESLPEGVEIEGFEYRRRDLHITGRAWNEPYQEFIDRLREREYFSSVDGLRPGPAGEGAEDKAPPFEIICEPE